MGLDRILGIFNIDMSPKACSPVEGDWVEDSVQNLCDTIQYVRTPEGFREVLVAYTKEVMIQHEMTDEELAFVMDAARMPYYLACAEYAIGVAGDYREEAKAADACPTCHTEFMIAEHWQDVAVPYMQKLCPNTELHVLGGHMAFWEHADKFNPILEKFLSRC